MKTIQMPKEQRMSAHNAEVYLLTKQIENNINRMYESFICALLCVAIVVFMELYVTAALLYIFFTINFGYTIKYHEGLLSDSRENYILGDEWQI